MFAPDHCKPPPKGQWRAWCASNYCRGKWLVVNEQRKIITQYSSAFDAARTSNEHNRMMRVIDNGISD